MVPCDFHRPTLKLYKRSDFDRKYWDFRLSSKANGVKYGWGNFFLKVLLAFLCFIINYKGWNCTKLKALELSKSPIAS